MDDFDHAQRLNEDFQAFCLQHQQHDREPANYTGSDCIDCDEEIPIERRKAQPGCRRCVKCQNVFELHDHWRAL